MSPVVRYAAPNENFYLVVGPHNGLGRAQRAKKILSNQPGALPGYQGRAPGWLSRYVLIVFEEPSTLVRQQDPQRVDAQRGSERQNEQVHKG